MAEADRELQDANDGEAVLPDALEELGDSPIAYYLNIDAVWVCSHSVAESLRRDSHYDHMAILPGRSAMVGDRLLWDLRRLRDVAVPEGV